MHGGNRLLACLLGSCLVPLHTPARAVAVYLPFQINVDDKLLSPCLVEGGRQGLPGVEWVVLSGPGRCPLGSQSLLFYFWLPGDKQAEPAR